MGAYTCSWRAVEDPTSAPAPLENPQPTLPHSGTPHSPPSAPQDWRKSDCGSGIQSIRSASPATVPTSKGNSRDSRDCPRCMTRESDGMGVNLQWQWASLTSVTEEKERPLTMWTHRVTGSFTKYQRFCWGASSPSKHPIPNSPGYHEQPQPLCPTFQNNAIENLFSSVLGQQGPQDTALRIMG